MKIPGLAGNLKLGAVLLIALFCAPGASRAQQFGNFDFQGTAQCAAQASPVGCLPIVLFAAAAGTFNSADLQNVYYKGGVFVANISAKSGTIAVVVNVQGKDLASGQYYTIASTASLTGTGATVLTLYPGTTAASNTVVNLPLPATWRIQVVSGTGSTPSVTMTVGASLIE